MLGTVIPWLMMFALNVLVETMSEPASRYSRVIVWGTSGLVIARMSLLPFWSWLSPRSPA